MSPYEKKSCAELACCRVLALLNGTHLYGQERANIQVLRALRDRGAKVVIGVSTLEGGGEVKEYIQDLGFRTVSFPFGGQWSKKLFRQAPSWLITNLAGVWRCSDLARNLVRETDATHIHLGSHLVYSYIAPYLAINRKIQVVYRMGDEPPHASRPNLQIWRSCFKRANAVVANSDFVRRSILRASPDSGDRIKLIYNRAVIDRTAKIVHASAGEEAKDARDTRFLYVGQLSPHKGIEDLLDATFRLANLSMGIRLDVVGESSYNPAYEDDLRKRVRDSGHSDRITFHGYQKDPTPFYEQADLLVVPSRFEEPGANVVLEAKRMGVPSIVYPSGGLPELVNHGENGFVCRNKSVDALMEAIQWYLGSQVRIAEHGRAAIADDETRFGYDRFWRQWGDVYLAQSCQENSLAQE